MIAIIIISLLLSAFFSGSEIAFISANKLEVEVNKKKGRWSGKLMASFFENPNRFIGSMLVGNNISLVVFTYFMTKLIHPYLVPYIGEGPFNLLVITIIIAIVVLIFGEFIPKTIFRLFATKILHTFSVLLVFFQWILSFPTWLMTSISEWMIKKIMRVPAVALDYNFSRVDLEDFIVDSDAVQNEELEKDIFVNALNLEQVKVRECMVPRTEIVSIDINEELESLIQLFKTSRHSRIIVTEDNIDNVLGYIHHRKILENPKNLKKGILELPYVPETMNVQDLLYKFIEERMGIACVVDEFGGTAGLITLEDILEEIFGEIVDEHDISTNEEIQISDREFLFSGRLEIDYLNEKYPQLKLPEDSDYHTLSGMIVMDLGDIPEQGLSFKIDHNTFTLEKVSEKKIEMVRISIDDI